MSAPSQWLSDHLNRRPDAHWVNVHIPKTAGSLFRRQMRRVLKLLAIDIQPEYDDYYQHLQDQLASHVDALRRDPVQFVSGHYRLRDAEAALDPIRERVVFTSFMRDPVDRFTSDFLFTRDQFRKSGQDVAPQFATIEAYLDAPGQSNKQLAYLRPTPGATVQDTFDHLRTLGVFVGLTERFEDHADFVYACLGAGAERQTGERANVGAHQAEAEAIKARYGAAILKANAEEHALYTMIRDSWDGR